MLQFSQAPAGRRAFQIILGTSLLMAFAVIAAIALQQAQARPAATARAPITAEIASSWVELPLNELIARSDLIVRGDVLPPLPSRWNTLNGELPAGAAVADVAWDTIIYTDTPVKVAEYLKGSAPEQTILARTLGGRVGQDTMTAEGPVLTSGSQVVLFLTSSAYETWDVGAEHFWPMGPQGVFRIAGNNVLSEGTRHYPARMPLAELLAAIAANGQ
ncbi:MAG: hypothetical protein ACRDHL_03615 [Candidatus Promineifilaceae bacterium]